MTNILIGCTSNAPDREHDAVVIGVTNMLLGHLNARAQEFTEARRRFPDVYRHEYPRGSVHYLKVDDGDYMDATDKPVLLSTYLSDLEILGPWSLEPARNVYLSVIKEGFFYSWPGRQDKHGPSERYETNTFTLEELKGLAVDPEPA